ncbi:MAG: efflux RND transporter permease subunit, partial [bacterium]
MRNSIVYATAIVVLVIFPLFFLSGLEGRLFAPLGLSYLVALSCSLFVSLTLTPVLGYWLLPHGRLLGQKNEPVAARMAKAFVKRILEWTLPRSTYVLFAVSIGVVVSC